MNALRIDGRRVGPTEPAYVIAEAGINHDGDYERARALVDAAANAGADAVKFQTFRARELYLDDRSGDEPSTVETFERLEMPHGWIPDLARYADDRGLTFLSTPFDEASADALDEHVPAFKIASATLSDHRFLRYVASKDKPMICSTGIHTREEVADAVRILEDAGAEFALLHCVSAYPTPLDAINVSMVDALREWFGVQTGLSDHTLDPVVAPTAAVARGATIVEKHVTTDSSREGGDHAMALEPDQLERMVTAIGQTEAALGSPYEGVHETEMGAYESARRGVFALVDIDTGEELTPENIGVRRANERERGLEPATYDDLLGRSATRPIDRFDPVTEDDVAL